MTTTILPKSLETVVWLNPERVSGAPCFYGTRVPVQNLFDYLKGGHTLEDFLTGFPPVTREQAETVLEASAHSFYQQLQLEARQQAKAQLGQMLRDGINSGDPVELTQADWDEMEAEVVRRAYARKEAQ
ncbi:MAG: DUF433 domain-containing protein [Acidobacteria bacterium]|nr:DUF433 domain-containing protein [Acidobacteriota bacterium]